MDNKLEYYISLFDYTYDDLVDYLVHKYGIGTDDYYREKSYRRFMKGEIKSITKGKYSRTQDGLYTHHIDENKISHLSSIDILKKNRVPFDHHRKGRLVYCDLIEHAILHMRIIVESDGKLGNGGMIFLIPFIEEWYVFGWKPDAQWALDCMGKSFLTKIDAFVLLEKFEQIPFVKADKIKKLERLYAGNREEYEKKFKSKEEFIQFYCQFPYASDETTAEVIKLEDKNREKRKESIKRIVKEEEKLRRNTYNSMQESIKNEENISRQSILRELYRFKYHKEYKDFKSFNSAMMPIIKRDLINEFQLIEYTPYNIYDRYQ